MHLTTLSSYYRPRTSLTVILALKIRVLCPRPFNTRGNVYFDVEKKKIKSCGFNRLSAQAYTTTRSCRNHSWAAIIIHNVIIILLIWLKTIKRLAEREVKFIKRDPRNFIQTSSRARIIWRRYNVTEPSASRRRLNRTTTVKITTILCERDKTCVWLTKVRLSSRRGDATQQVDC